MISFEASGFLLLVPRLPEWQPVDTHTNNQAGRGPPDFRVKELRVLGFRGLTLVLDLDVGVGIRPWFGGFCLWIVLSFWFMGPRFGSGFSEPKWGALCLKGGGGLGSAQPPIFPTFSPFFQKNYINQNARLDS